MSGVAACAWPAFLASSHPGCQCKGFPVFRPRTRTSTARHQLCPSERPSHKRFPATSLSQATAAQGVVQDPPAERQQTTYSRHVPLQGSLNIADDPQGSIAGQSGRARSGDVPHVETAGATSSTYSKEERAKLASIPESEMNPEMLRRWRISKANKGKQPWNKGRQHPPGNTSLLYVFACIQACAMLHIEHDYRDVGQNTCGHQGSYVAARSACQGQSQPSFWSPHTRVKGELCLCFVTFSCVLELARHLRLALFLFATSTLCAKLKMQLTAVCT